MNIIFRLFVFVFIVGTALVVTGESKMNTPERQKYLDKRLLKIMTSDKYLYNRSTEMKAVIKKGAVITSETIEFIFDEWLRSAQRRDGDFSLIHFTPDMLSEENKDTFNKAALGINREEVIKKLNALNLVIDHSPKKITGAFEELINPKFGMFAKSDMSIYWLGYFLSKENTDVNAIQSKSISPMLTAIFTINYDVAKLLIKYGYKPNSKDFEFIQQRIAEVKKDEIAEYHQESTIEALSKIETLLMDNIKNRVPEPPPSRGFFD